MDMSQWPCRLQLGGSSLDGVDAGCRAVRLAVGCCSHDGAQRGAGQNGASDRQIASMTELTVSTV